MGYAQHTFSRADLGNFKLYHPSPRTGWWLSLKLSGHADPLAKTNAGITERK